MFLYVLAIIYFYTFIIIEFALFHSVMMVKSAKDALSVLRSSDLSFDIVIIEVHMPEMNDFQLQQEIAKDFGIPVVCEFIIFYILHKTRISFLFITFGS